MKRPQIGVSLACWLVLWLFAAGCDQPRPASGPEDKIKVVATIFPLSDFVRQVGGERVEVLTLLPPAASPHVYSPAPRDLAQIQGARLFIKIGLGFEFWAGDLARSGAGQGITEIDTSRGVEVIQESEPGHDHDHEIANPHIWLDPVTAKEQVKRIEEALSGIDPARQGEYRANAASYMKQLDELDLDIRERISRFKQKSFFSFHPSWAYFARRYGLIEAGVIETSPGREPTPREIMKIVSKLRETGARAIFAEPQLNPKAAHVIASEAGVKVLILDPIGTPDHEERSSYLKLMRYNLAVLEQGMGSP